MAVNQEIVRCCGKPVVASAGQMTRSDNEASRRASKVDLGMARFNPRNGANTRGNYIAEGVNDPFFQGSTKGRSQLRAAGETR